MLNMMMSSLPTVARWRTLRRQQKSQALAEFAIILPILLTFVCGLFDYGLMVSNSQVVAMMVREGANVASRYDTTPIDTALAAMVDNGKPTIALTTSRGGAIITYVTRASASTNLISLVSTASASVGATGSIFGGGSSLKNASRLVTNGDWTSTARQLPFTVATLDVDQKMYCVEVFYSNQFVTPVGKLVGIISPAFIYDAAFF
jgi:Flp pilus assembly protein TadG